MLEPPIATSSPVPRTKQWGRRKSKNNRRSISLLDVSVIQTPDVASPKSGSNETLTSICKDSGYVRSEGSWLEDEESKESKDLAEELKFKDVLISELQESNRGLRIRCADAENKIWRLRVKCEEHCGCCQVQGADTRDDEDELFIDSNDQFCFPNSSLPSHKRHSLAVSKFNPADKGYGGFLTSATSGTASNHRQETSLLDKPLLRSLSSGMIPMQKSRIKNDRGHIADLQLTPESLSLSKVQWWQRDLFTQSKESVEESTPSEHTAQQKFNRSRKKRPDESYNCNQPDELSALVSNDARLISNLVLQHNEGEYAENVERNVEQSEKWDHYSLCGSDENGNRTNNRKDVNTLQSSPEFLSRTEPVHSYSESDSSFSPPFPPLPTKNRVRVRDGVHIPQTEVKHAHPSDSFDGPPREYRTSNQNNLIMSEFPEDANAQTPSCELGCCLNPQKTGVNNDICSSSLPKMLNANNVFHSRDSFHPPSQIVIVPAGCCCRLIDSSSLCRQNCCPYEGNAKCDQQCPVSSKHSCNSFSDAPPAELHPLFVTKSKSASAQCKDQSHLPINANNCGSAEVSGHIPTQEVNPCNNNSCNCASTCSGGLTVPLAQRLDVKAKMEREIKERMNTLASNGRAETDSLSFKPWPPPHFAEMSPLMRCLAETSDYARQMAMAFEKVNGRVQRIFEMSQLRPSV